MKKGIGVLMLVLGTGQIMAATEFEDNVPVELAKIFLNPGNAPDVGLYTDIMDGFPPFDLPDGFTVLGSLDQGRVQRVVLSTGMEREAAGSTLFDALAAEGWLELPQPQELAQPRGFVPSGGAQPNGIALNLCHDEHGNLTLSVLDGEDGNIVSVMRVNNRLFGGMQMNCEQQVQQMTQGFNPRGMMMGGVSEHMPTLRMPERESRGQVPAISRVVDGFFSSGGGGSSNDFETRGNLGIDWEITRIYDFFAEQMVEQGWEEDSAWAGDITAGGNWTRSPGDDLNLIAILSIVETAEEVFELKLRLLSRGAQSGASFGVINAITP